MNQDEAIPPPIPSPPPVQVPPPLPTPQPPRLSAVSVLLWAIVLMLICAALVPFTARMRLPLDLLSDPRAAGRLVGTATFAWAAFHFLFIQRMIPKSWLRGFLSIVSIVVIFAVVLATTYVAGQNRLQKANEIASLSNKLDQLAQGTLPAPAVPTKPAGGWTSVEEFTSQFWGKLAGAHKAYQSDLHAIGWERILDAERLVADKNFTDSIIMLKQVQQIFEKYRTTYNAVIEEARKDVQSLSGDDFMKGFAIGFESSLPTMKAKIEKQMTLEQEALEKIEAIVTILRTGAGWKLEGGQLIFNETADMNKYNEESARLDEIVAEQEAMQKQELEETKAKLNNSIQQLKH